LPQSTAPRRAADFHKVCNKYYATRGNYEGVTFDFLKAVIKQRSRRASMEELIAIASFVAGAQMMYGLTRWKICSFLGVFLYGITC
jgi:endonuclease V-like protein UPF0215 family